MDSIFKSHLTKCVGFLTILLMVAIPKCMDNVNALSSWGGGGAVYVSSVHLMLFCVLRRKACRGAIPVPTHFCVVCPHFNCLMSLF